MRSLSLTKGLPGWKNALLALMSAILLILAFPDFDYWFLAWFALVPLMWAVGREVDREHPCPPELDGRNTSEKPQTLFRTLAKVCGQGCPRSFVLGWIFGTAFFFGTCWWLTYAPITYAAFPPMLAYFLLFLVCLMAGLFPAMFAAILSVLLRRFGSLAFLAAPFVWVFTEFLRYWITGNNWNALGYSQAFTERTPGFAECGGVLFVGFLIAIYSSLLVLWTSKPSRYYVLVFAFFFLLVFSDVYTIAGVSKFNGFVLDIFPNHTLNLKSPVSQVVALQPNVPMSGLTYEKWQALRQRHVSLAESALAKLTTDHRPPTTVIFPES
ncbi:MAG TPA: hypothetical protein PLK77_18375, partial [Pyrinomonadaceae bacterium]|nr:hypothetical protein [Pyrinomonadaceae bacterium]